MKGKLTPFQEFIYEAKYEHCWTDDVPDLMMKDFHYVFVYNSNRGKSSSFLTHDTSDATFIGISFTQSEIYSIINVETEVKKVSLASPSGVSRILGELWLVPTEFMLEFDVQEFNLLHTHRIRIPVVAPDRTVILAWCYLGDPRYLAKADTVAKSTPHTGCTYIGTQRFLECH